ncbi:MAG: hypothetical protein K2O08_01730, partial [Clostridia bacterium]|nr:hypothetical protein [Clostridia bacterium]
MGGRQKGKNQEEITSLGNMMQPIEESLFQAIKKDDKKAFDALMETTQCGAYRLGRFPTLSLLYLYKARKILSAYEEKFLEITNYTALSEPIEVSAKFSSKAGKCLRLYLNEIVSPLEMLLILDKTMRLKRVYPMTKNISSSIKGRLKTIYFIKYSLSVKFEGNSIVIDKRPLSYREKKKIATICTCLILAITIAIGVPVTTVSLIPKPIEGEVTKLSHIDFSSEKEYTLKKDIVLPENYSVEKVNCIINGDGKKLIFGKGANLGDLNGKLSDLTIDSSGDAIFNSITENAAIENVTVNVNADISTEKSTALIALTNYGTIENVTVNVSGNINAIAKSTDVTEELTFGGIVNQNNVRNNNAIGTIKNCVVNYSQFTLVGESSANAVFGGVAGVNNGYLQDCKVTGEIVADTFDIAGVCSVNNGLLSGNTNEADLSQTSADTGWNPIVCGIVLRNAYAVEKCQNTGRISAVSNCSQFEVQEEYEPTASATGIAYLNRSTMTTPYILNSDNLGDIECSADYRHAYAAGVCLSSSGAIENCKNSGEVNGKANNGFDAYVGGITTLAYGDIYKAVNEGNVSATAGGTAYVGGISAQAVSQLSYCHSSGDITVTAENVYAGGIIGFTDVATSASIYGGVNVYFGIADRCISENQINASVIGDKPAYVGGIVGYVSEKGFNDNEIYYGGCVTNCYFIGERVSDVLYFGNIVGVCDVNIYEINSFTSGNSEYYNFG